MTLTLLLDLDNTLLDNDMGAFIPAYLNGLAEAMSAYVPPEELVPALLKATQAMQENTDLRRTLKQTFDHAFYPALGLNSADAQDLIDHYYAEKYPAIATLTAPRPVAIDFVREAFHRGHRIAIATNPLFPRTAIAQRLAWAGLPIEANSFSLVSCYEEFHFTKPSPAYFAEVLARLGWPEGPALVIGDDPANDAAPAAKLGLASFLVRTDLPDSVAPRKNNAGGIEDILDWISAQPAQTLVPSLDSRDAILATYRTSHAAIAAFAAGKDLAALRTRPAEGEWSLTEILCHFRDVDAEVTAPRLKTILSSEDAFIAAVDPDTWAKPRRYNEQDPLAVLEEWLNLRYQIMAVLDALTDADWERQIRHSIFGPTTLLELMRFSARHDRLHIQQAANTLERVA
ncbi:MAG: HAD-IA family hydrolase [Chloroflexi bacterium]|nr:HAD-IA family hydrolase [Chloroflexota bacterium]